MNAFSNAVAAAILLAAAGAAHADPVRTETETAPAGPKLRLDVEIDPTAYVLNGYSLHVGIGVDRIRLDLGAYAIDAPEAYHGNKGFDASMHGFGAKLQLFFSADQVGGFAGVSGGVGKTLVARRGTSLASLEDNFSVGVDAGWRFDLGAGFYATPWVSLDYEFAPKDVELGGETFETGHWSVFPAVHFGRRFL